MSWGNRRLRLAAGILCLDDWQSREFAPLCRAHRAKLIQPSQEAGERFARSSLAGTRGAPKRAISFRLRSVWMVPALSMPRIALERLIPRFPGTHLTDPAGKSSSDDGVRAIRAAQPEILGRIASRRFQLSNCPRRAEKQTRQASARGLLLRSCFMRSTPK